MKSLLLLLSALLVSFASFGQEWQFQKGGNAFDGFYRGATIFPVDNSYNIVLLNRGEELRLEWGFGGENTMDKLKIVIFTEGLVNPKSIKMSFDNERKVYDVDFFFNEEKSFYNLNEAYANNYSELYNKFSIIDLFKKHNKVNFRISNGDKKIDFSFTLAGFTKTVNNVVLYNNSETDEKLNTLSVVSLISLMPKEVNQIDIWGNCTSYLRDNYGEYYMNLVDSIELIKNKEVDFKGLSSSEYFKVLWPELIFKNKYGVTIASIQSNYFLKNALYYSGNLKMYEKSKLLKDDNSLKDVYSMLTENPSLIEDISFEEFTLASKTQISEYYTIFIDQDCAKKMNKYKTPNGRIVSEYYLINYYGQDNFNKILAAGKITLVVRNSLYKDCSLRVFSESWGFKP